MSSLHFTVPGKPCGVNATFTGNWKRPFGKTREAAEFIESVAFRGLKARREAKWSTTSSPVDVAIRAVFADEKPDLDGPLKPVLDALQVTNARTGRIGSGIITNDRQVKAILLLRDVDRARPRVEVTVGHDLELERSRISYDSGAPWRDADECPNCGSRHTITGRGGWMLDCRACGATHEPEAHPAWAKILKEHARG